MRTSWIQDRDLSLEEMDFSFDLPKPLSSAPNHPVASVSTSTPRCRGDPGFPSSAGQRAGLATALGWRISNGIRSRGRWFFLVKSPCLLTEYVSYLISLALTRGNKTYPHPFCTMNSIAIVRRHLVASRWRSRCSVWVNLRFPARTGYHSNDA